MNIRYEKELPVKYSYDVIVAGGGPAGIAAAYGAAKSGASVLLLERSGSLGGASALCGVPELMNFDDGQHFLAHGFGSRVYDALGLSCAKSRAWYSPKTEVLKRVYDTLLTDAGVKLLLYTTLTDVVTADAHRISHVILSSLDGPYAAEAKVFIDATGSALLTALAGYPTEYGDENGVTMSATLCSMWGGIDFSRKGRDADDYERAYADGIFSQYDPALAGIKPNHPEIGVGLGNIGHAFALDDRSEEAMTEATLAARKMLTEYERFYTGYVAGCERAELIRSADYIGIRESRRVQTLYMMQQEDFFREEAFPDEIGRYSYPIDIHPMTPDRIGYQNFHRAVAVRHADGESYSIPYRALVPAQADNLLVAGRAIGADRPMQASLRVIPCCYITGQAAGCAGALAAKGGVSVRDVPTEALREKIATL